MGFPEQDARREPRKRKGASREPKARPGGPIRLKRRRATLPHPLECSTIAAPGLSYRVRNGTGRLTRAMTTAKPRSRNDSQNTWRPFRPFNYHVAVWEPASGREANAYRLNRIRDHQALIVAWDRSTGKTRNQPSTREGSELLCRRRPLVPVGSTPHGASTSGLSNTCSTCGLQRFETVRNPNLGAGFPLRCFQRLSLPNVANRPCRWRDNRHTRGSSTQVLSYYGQASSGFQRAQRIETKLSHDVLNPARVPL